MSRRECSATSRWMVLSGWCRLRAMPSTSCSAPTCATSGCCGAGSTSKRASARLPTNEFVRLSGVVRLNKARQQSVRLSGVRVGVVAGRRGLGCPGAARQRKILALIQRADAALVEAGFIDLQIGTVQRIRRQLLDRELHCGGRGVEAAIGKTRPLFLADCGWKQFGGSVVAKGSHGQ